jgi:hypothetical protein
MITTSISYVTKLREENTGFGGLEGEDSRGKMKELFTVKIHMTSTQKLLYTWGITACSTFHNLYIAALFLLANFQQKRKTKSKIENEVNF